MFISMVHNSLWWSLVVAVGYLLVANAISAVRCALAAPRLLPQLAREERSSLASSRFTVPVSLVVHEDADGREMLASVRSLLDQDYPLFEVIVVADSARSEAIDTLKAAFDLVPRQVFYRRNVGLDDVR